MLSHLRTETSSYSTSERLLLVLTLSIPALEGSILPHLSTSSLKCSPTTLAWAFLTVMTAPSLIPSSYSFLATRTTHPYWSPTRTSAYLINVPSYLLLSLVILIDWTYGRKNMRKCFAQNNRCCVYCFVTYFQVHVNSCAGL